MEYKAKNLDVDKALDAIKRYEQSYRTDEEKDLLAVKKYYEGLREGLNYARTILTCSNYEKDGKEN